MAAVSKRLRFEVFKRDDHTCQYCGRSAPEVVLQVDHIQPTSLGGENKPANLITACRDCNAGKGSSTPDAPRIEAPSVDGLRWARAIEEAAADHRRYREAEQEAIAAFRYHWPVTTCPDDHEATIRKFVRLGLDAADIVHVLEQANKRATGGLRHTWLYFCKVCWSEVRRIRERAQETLRLEADHAELIAEEPDERDPADMLDPFEMAMDAAERADLERQQEPMVILCVECDERPAEREGMCLPCTRWHYEAESG